MNIIEIYLIQLKKSIAILKNREAEHHQTLYTCPMHPDVVSAEPGKCPKCGMMLKLPGKKSK